MKPRKMKAYGLPRFVAASPTWYPGVYEIQKFAHRTATGGKDYFRGRKERKAIVRRYYKRRARAENKALCREGANFERVPLDD